MAAQRICIFCGAPPENKNKEHPLPKWLLALTGDPKRVVRHGYRWSDNKVFEFSFDSLAFPACAACNARYSGFEEYAKQVVEKICRKEAATPTEYVHLLDWLDKVRIGLWLGYRYLQQNPHPPNFTIDSRIGTKDRMVAVYTIGDHQKGLNTWGPESRLFQNKPSVFALRVNNILFLNASWDYMCAGRCGYPFPREVTYSREHHGLISMGSFRSRGKITHPVMPGLMKSCVTLVQPVLQLDAHGGLVGRTQKDVNYHLQHAWPSRNGLGPLIRQFSAETVRIDDTGPRIEFDSVSLAEANRAVDIATQAYCLQNESIRRDPKTYDDGAPFEGEARMKAYAKENTAMLRALRDMPPEQYNQLASQVGQRDNTKPS